MNYILLLLTLSSYIIQEKQNSLVNTRWEYKVTENCINHIFFNADGTYINYSCEIDYPFSGTYDLKKDTIYFVEIDLASDLPGERKTVVKNRMKGHIKKDKLQFFDLENFVDGKWEKSNDTASPEIFYKKVKN